VRGISIVESDIRDRIEEAGWRTLVVSGVGRTDIGREGKTGEVGKVNDDLVLKGCLYAELSAGGCVGKVSSVSRSCVNRCPSARAEAGPLYSLVERFLP
jgi:hypothetical protein